jgi:hypothetical protein
MTRITIQSDGFIKVVFPCSIFLHFHTTFINPSHWIVLRVILHYCSVTDQDEPSQEWEEAENDDREEQKLKLQKEF